MLIAIALEGVATRMLSHEMTDRYELGANSTVAKSLKNLCDEDKLNLVLKAGNAYKLQEKAMPLPKMPKLTHPRQ